MTKSKYTLRPELSLRRPEEKLPKFSISEFFRGCNKSPQLRTKVDHLKWLKEPPPPNQKKRKKGGFNHRKPLSFGVFMADTEVRFAPKNKKGKPLLL